MPLNSALRRNDGRIEVRFDFDRKVVDHIRKIPGRVWINDRKVWNFPGDDNTVNALKSVFGKCVDKFLGNNSKPGQDGVEADFFVAFPRKEKKLQNVLSRDEVQRIIASVSNTKHRLMLMLIYSGGLRVSEAASVLLEDIDRDRRVIRIRQSKGYKDRSALLSERTFEVVKEYCRIYKPEKWLFPGEEDGSHISTRTIQAVFNEACKMAGIQKKATVHGLRHTSSKTAEICTHVGSRRLMDIPNPLDDIIG